MRPLYSEVLRYGPYSRGGEFEYDRPHLWGSRRTGPDLARVGGRYPDAWHYRHMVDPQTEVPGSTMPPYPWLEKRRLDTSHTRRKLEILGYPITDAGLAELQGKTELDALVAYLQCLGTAFPRQAAVLPIPREKLVNPYADNAAAIAEGEALFMENCAGCHGVELKGDAGTGITSTELVDHEKGDEADIVADAWEGVEGMMPAFGPILGVDRLWKIANYITSK